MKFINSLFFSCIAILLIFSFTTCAERDNENDPANPNYSVSATTTPASGSNISGHEDIVIQFSDSMDKNSIILGGTLLTANIQPISDSAVWSARKFSNDTLTIRMKDLRANWKVLFPKGSGQQLTVEGTASAGKAMSKMTATFNVVYRIYASITTGGAAPSYNGSSTKPLNSIQDCITLAADLINGYSSDTSEIYVAQGTYSSNYSSTGTPVINMVQKISVYGGYSSSNWSRNITSYESILEDTSTAGGGSRTTANRVVTIGSGITSTTVIDGFKFKTANLGHSTGIYCDSSSPTIFNNTIIGSAYTDGSGDIYGIICNNSSPSINSNTIYYEWNNSKALNSYGIHQSGSGTPSITSNIIYGGKAVSTRGIYAGTGATITSNSIYGNSPGAVSGNTTSYGIFIDYASPSIENNTRIDCGKGTSAAICIYVRGDGTTPANPAINSNTLSNINLTTDWAYGIYEAAAAGSDPSSVSSNDFDGYFGGNKTNTGYYYDEAGTRIYDFTTNINNAATNTLTGWSNVSTFTSN